MQVDPICKRPLLLTILTANRDEDFATNNSVVSATRGATAFDYTETTSQYIYSYSADITPASSSAKARTDFGSNRAQAAAWNSRVWTEERVQSAWDFTQSSITGGTRAGAAAWSIYTEVLTPDKDGQVILQFELDQHPGGSGSGLRLRHDLRRCRHPRTGNLRPAAGRPGPGGLGRPAPKPGLYAARPRLTTSESADA